MIIKMLDKNPLGENRGDDFIVLNFLRICKNMQLYVNVKKICTNC